MSAVLERQTYNYIPDEYEGLSSTFANDCREADRTFRKQQSNQPSAKPDGPAKSTLDAIDYLLREKDEARLKEFLGGRSRSEAEKLLAYIERKTS
jgi:hypothetical protein